MSEFDCGKTPIVWEVEAGVTPRGAAGLKGLLEFVNGKTRRKRPFAGAARLSSYDPLEMQAS